MGFKIVWCYKRIKCDYFKALNNADILWIITSLTLTNTKIATENINIIVSQLQSKAELAI